jgi:hypothetical protein
MTAKLELGLYHVTIGNMEWKKEMYRFEKILAYTAPEAACKLRLEPDEFISEINLIDRAWRK